MSERCVCGGDGMLMGGAFLCGQTRQLSSMEGTTSALKPHPGGGGGGQVDVSGLLCGLQL